MFKDTHNELHVEKFYNDDLPDFFKDPKNYHFKSNVLDQYPLHSAAFFGDLNSVKKLIKLGVDLDMPGDIGHTALHNAARSGYFEIVKLLVKAGADVRIEDMFGETAQSYACSSGYYEIANWLSQASEKKYLDISAVLSLYKKNYFNNHVIDVNSKNESGESPIHIAARRKRKDEMRIILQECSNVNTLTDNIHKMTALHYSIGLCDLKMMALLLKSGADFNLKTRLEHSAFDLAILMGNKEIIFYLYSFIAETGNDSNKCV
ncbi:ankyrin repeat domain-containing protein [Salmonella enterica]|uniref:ankyrin repeat domain-containing protein n=1 Tax=Salmonella enterica TaxID=28901 RepID=UPI0013E97B1B|nr:ankyrin repeat domain-containing protein [Salmonella enterica]EDS4738606.1 ankyrin repeat domain-containing protein [Salmonella enterica subsp. enterica serovar Oranienburg]EIX6435742.1 ankyrin repeat domain-containing protein [Salmonella enterica]